MFFYRDNKETAAQAAGPAGVAAAAAVAAPRDRTAWERSIRVQFTSFKANHGLGKSAATERKAAGEKAAAAKRVGVLAKRQPSPAAGAGAAGKPKVRISGQVREIMYQDP